MTKFKKIGEIHGFKKDIDKEVLETLENQGLFTSYCTVLSAISRLAERSRAAVFSCKSPVPEQ